MLRSFSLLATVLAVLTADAHAAAPQLPPGVFAGERDYKLALAGTYILDPDHTAVIAKVSHIGYALSVFRFGIAEGTLTWDPAQPARSNLKATVTTASISTPVAGFAKQLAGADYLNSVAYPKATFVSTSFHPSDDTHGRVDGQFTLLGRTRPLSFDVTLQGAGKGFMGHPRLGVEATAQLDPQDFGLNPMLSTPIRIDIDAEFQRR
jgi:polyisoprenoid-binding protein YceI